MSKFICFIHLFLCILSTSKAQSGEITLTCPSVNESCTFTPYNGTLNLYNPPSSGLYPFLVNYSVNYAKSPLNANFRDVKYKDDDNYQTPTIPPSPCEAPSSNQCDADGSNLIYDVYYPDPNIYNYSICQLPAVILFHAGGFMECSHLGLPGIVTVCEELAKRGFVAFSVEYRGGRIKDPDEAAANYTSVQQQLAVYRACQDARGAIRSIIKRQNNHSSFPDDHYQIDVNSIFVGGMSAGGIAALNASWYTPLMVSSVFPNGGSGSSTITQALGSIDPNYYYASDVDVLNFQSHILGNAAMWTAVQIPYAAFELPTPHEYDFFDSTLLKPTITFQGDDDDVFHYALGSGQYVYFEPPSIPPITIDYNSESFCVNTSHGPFFQEGIGTTVDLVNGSTLNMKNILDYYHIPNEHYVDSKMKHGVKSHGVYDGDFCSGATTEHDAYVYIAQRIACFFQAILSGKQANLGTNYFLDCKNVRKGCSSKITGCPTCTQ